MSQGPSGGALLVSSSIAGWVAYDEPGFPNSVGMPTICIWRAVSLCSFAPDPSLSALVAPARRNARRIPGSLLFLSFVFFALFPFCSVGMEWAAGRARRWECRFGFWLFDGRRCRSLLFCLFVCGIVVRWRAGSPGVGVIPLSTAVAALVARQGLRPAPHSTHARASPALRPCPCRAMPSGLRPSRRADCDGC